MTKEKYTEEPLNDDEKIQSQLNVDSLTSNIETAKFDLNQMDKQLAIQLPQRQAAAGAKEAIDKKKLELKRFEDQFKMYQLRVRTGKKKVPKIDTPTK